MNETRGLWRGKRYIPPYEWVEGLLTHRDFDPVQPAAEITVESGANYSVNPETLGECTGLRDKNGKPIFEGDFVKHYCYKDDPTRFNTGVIFWEEKYARFKKINNDGDTYFIVYDEAYPYEVIGNIHDNPELLNGTGEDIGNAAQDTLAPAT